MQGAEGETPSGHGEDEPTRVPVDALPGIRSRLDTVEKALDEHNGPPFDDSLRAYRDWAPTVGRYSFQWRRVSTPD